MEAEGACEGMLLGLSQGSADGEIANHHQIHNVMCLRDGGKSSEEEQGSDGESSEEEEDSDGERVAASARFSSE
ncbi:MAG: hypothetical protein ACKPKO_16375, partial [Candidatus Fonsibacter sp.]